MHYWNIGDKINPLVRNTGVSNVTDGIFPQ